MITILNRKRLLADSSSETAAKAREALKAAGIPYYMKTVQNHTSLGKSIHAGAGVGAFRGGGAAEPEVGRGVQRVADLSIISADAAC